jgi:flagellar motor switch protein FliG
VTTPAQIALGAIEANAVPGIGDPADAMTVTTVREPGTPLTNLQKIAVVVAQLGPKKAGPILDEMSDEDAIAITKEIAGLPALDTDTVVAVLAEFVAKVNESSLVNQGGMELARQFLLERLGEDRAGEVLTDMESALTQGGPGGLAGADPKQVAAILSEQQPQTVAVLLAHLRPEEAARFFGELPAAFRTKVARRIARLDQVDPAAVRQTTTLVEAKLRSLQTQGAPMAAAGGAAAVAEILNNSERAIERQLLGELETEDGELAARIRANLFTFDDVVALEDRWLQQILRRVPPPVLAAALKGDELDPETIDRVRSNLTERASQNLDEELEVLGTIRASQVDAAQTEVVRATRELEAEGVIVIARDEEDVIT